MSKKLDCIVDGCSATIEGENEQEVVTRAREHAQQEHPTLNLDDETVELVRSNIETV